MIVGALIIRVTRDSRLSPATPAPDDSSSNSYIDEGT